MQMRHSEYIINAFAEQNLFKLLVNWFEKNF